MNRNKPWMPLLLLFIILNAFFLSGKRWLEKQGINQEVLIVGDLVLAIATGLSLYISVRSLRSPSPQAPIRAMYGSFMIKFFLCAIAAFIYIMIEKKNVNKPGLIACMGLYLVYTFMEVSALTKLLKQKKNA